MVHLQGKSESIIPLHADTVSVK